MYVKIQLQTKILDFKKFTTAVSVIKLVSGEKVRKKQK